MTAWIVALARARTHRVDSRCWGRTRHSLGSGIASAAIGSFSLRGTDTVTEAALGLAIGLAIDLATGTQRAGIVVDEVGRFAAAPEQQGAQRSRVTVLHHGSKQS